LIKRLPLDLKRYATASMKSKKDRLKESRLYAIVEPRICIHKPIIETAGKLKGADIDLIQLRDKEGQKDKILRDALSLKKILAKSKVIFIINDYLDIAKIINSDGLHLGQADTSIETARKILGRDKIIGISCHNLKQAIDAEKRGADYISIGPIFSTATKPQYKPIGLYCIKQIKKKIKIPFFVIGGINQKNIQRVISSGVKRIAMCRALCQAKDIFKSAKFFQKILK
jgi:thiamine-phosphate pyrophosphorylase